MLQEREYDLSVEGSVLTEGMRVCEVLESLNGCAAHAVQCSGMCGILHLFGGTLKILSHRFTAVMGR